MASNLDWFSLSCFELIIENILDIQSSLSSEYRNESVLQNKLLIAIKYVKSCQLAYYKPAETVQGVISDLHVSLATAKRYNLDHANHIASSALFVNRRYTRKDAGKVNNSSTSKNYYVCKRIGCCSSNHSSSKDINFIVRTSSLDSLWLPQKKPSELDEDDEQVAEAVEDIFAHMIHDNSKTIEYASASTKVGSCQESFSNFACIDDEDGLVFFVARMLDAAFSHAANDSILKQRFGKRFKGVFVDTGAVRGGISGSAQYQAYSRYVGKKPIVDDGRAATSHFGIGSAKSFGMESVSFSIERIWFCFGVHVVEVDTSILSSIDDMSCLGIYLNNLEDKLIHPELGLLARITRIRGNPFIYWNPHISCFLSSTELR